jgi:hypothetical protein
MCATHLRHLSYGYLTTKKIKAPVNLVRRQYFLKFETYRGCVCFEVERHIAASGGNLDKREKIVKKNKIKFVFFTL